MAQDDKAKAIKDRMAKIKAQGYPLIRDVKAENAIEIMSQLLEHKKKHGQSH